MEEDIQGGATDGNEMDCRPMEREIDEELVRALYSGKASEERIRELVARGANVNARDSTGIPVLEHGLFGARLSLDVIRCLVELGAEINDTNGLGNATLEVAAIFSGLDVIKLLVELGARIDPEDWDLLYTACQNNTPDVLAFLLGRGLNPNTMPDMGETVLDDVLQCCKAVPKSRRTLREIVKVLRDAGGRRANELRANRLGTWLQVAGYCPTGLYTDTGCLPVNLLPNVTKGLFVRGI